MAGGLKVVLLVSTPSADGALGAITSMTGGTASLVLAKVTGWVATTVVGALELITVDAVLAAPFTVQDSAGASPFSTWTR